MGAPTVVESHRNLDGTAAVSPMEPRDLANGSLEWDSDVRQQPDEQNIVFILPSARGSTSHLVYSLTEDTSNAEEPYKLSVYRASGIPKQLLERHVLSELPPHLQAKPTNRVNVIVSTKSGTGLALKCWDGIVQPLIEAAGLRTAYGSSADSDGRGLGGGDASYRVLVTDSAQSVRRFARERWGEVDGSQDAAAARTETVVLLSGDGGVVDLLNGSDAPTSPSAPRPVIALLPLGTGNALFHSLHKPLYSRDGGGPTPLVAGLRTLFRGTAAALPTFRASFSPRSRIVSYADLEAEPGLPKDAVEGGKHHEDGEEVDHLVGAIVASYGFHASIVWESDTPEHRRHGEARFGMVARELLRESHAYAASVEIRRPTKASSASSTTVLDGAGPWERLPRDAFGYVLATLVSNLERGFTISPASAPLSGRLRLVHFGPVGGERTMQVMVAAYNDGAHVGMRWRREEREGGGEDGVGYDEIEGVRVTVREGDARWRKMCIDGTIVEVEEGGWMVVETMGTSGFDVLVDRSVLVS